MGLDKFKNLIITAREDHNQGSPTHRPGSPKVHFDLQGYDVLFWNPDDLRGFKDELEKRIRRRLAIIRPPAEKPVSPWDTGWIERNRLQARGGLEKLALTGFTEIQFALSHPKISKSPDQLLAAADQSVIHTFGWPIGLVLHDEYRPRPVADGIVAEVPAETFKSYDYWTLKRDGDFYLLQSLFEDERRPGHIFYDTRIVRITEALLYCARLYTRLGVPGASAVHFRLRHGGLKGRILSGSAPGHWSSERKSIEDEIHTEIVFELASVDSSLVGIVMQLIQPLLELFEFFEIPAERYEGIINEFVKATAESEQRRNPPPTLR